MYSEIMPFLGIPMRVINEGHPSELINVIRSVVFCPFLVLLMFCEHADPHCLSGNRNQRTLIFPSSDDQQEDWELVIEDRVLIQCIHILFLYLDFCNKFRDEIVCYGFKITNFLGFEFERFFFGEKLRRIVDNETFDELKSYFNGRTLESIAGEKGYEINDYKIRLNKVLNSWDTAYYEWYYGGKYWDKCDINITWSLTAFIPVGLGFLTSIAWPHFTNPELAKFGLIPWKIGIIISLVWFVASIIISIVRDCKRINRAQHEYPETQFYII
jgi:hypothetical protein